MVGVFSLLMITVISSRTPAHMEDFILSTAYPYLYDLLSGNLTYVSIYIKDCPCMSVSIGLTACIGMIIPYIITVAYTK